jgi:hypothetical protein
MSDGTQFVTRYEGSGSHVYVNKKRVNVASKQTSPNLLDNKGDRIVFVASGEFREPEAYEYFFSGAPITAYLATQNLTTKYWIAVPVAIKTQVVVTQADLIL